MNCIKTIDLWTEQLENHYECFNGAFVDGFELDYIPFDEYKIIKNCNCFISVEKKEIKISNKHQAIVFYKKKIPVRLFVINKNTNIEKCVEIALSQYFQNITLKEIYEKYHIQKTEVDLKEKPIEKESDYQNQIDVGSCDRWTLLFNMLKGSYTESETSYGNFQNDKYEFLPNLNMKYELQTDKEKFEIEHDCCFINLLKTRIIPIQKNSNLVKEKEQ